MEGKEDILKSLAPIVIIIVLSWLLSLMGRIKRGQHQESEVHPQQTRQDSVFDLKVDTSYGQPPVEPLDDLIELPPTEERRRPAPGAQPPATPGRPRVDARPIEPKWWGA